MQINAPELNVCICGKRTQPPLLYCSDRAHGLPPKSSPVLRQDIRSHPQMTSPSHSREAYLKQLSIRPQTTMEIIEVQP